MNKTKEKVKLDEILKYLFSTSNKVLVKLLNAIFEEDCGHKIIKIGAEIPFTRYFYKYQQPTPSEELKKKFLELENAVDAKIKKLFGAA